MTRCARLSVLLLAMAAMRVAAPGQSGSGDAGHAVSPLALPLQPANAFSLAFDKLLETYHWNGQVRYRNNDGPFRYALTEQSLSTIILSDRKLTRDEHSFGLGLRQQLSDRFSAALQESSYVLSDNQSFGIGSASSHAFYGGMDYRPFDRVSIEPLAGFRLDNQMDQRDKGPSYMLALLANGIDVSGYQASFAGRHRYDRLDPRILETHLDTLRLDKEFIEGTRNALRVTFNRNRRDFYFPADTSVIVRYGVANNIQTRTENIFGVGDSLAYALSQRAALTIQGDIFSRGIGNDVRYQNVAAGYNEPHVDISEFRLDGSAGMAFNPWSGVDGMIQLLYQERDEEHSLQPLDSLPPAVFASKSTAAERLNNQSRRTALSWQVNVGLSDADTVSLSYVTGILRYDTPSSENTDDRDELRDMVSLGYQHRFSPFFAVSAIGEVDLFHLVYLSSQRSADNTWNRIYRFSPQLWLAPSPSFSTVNTFEVLANYTIYDFDYASAATRSFTFRQFSFVDSTSLMLTKRIGLQWFSNIRLYERGELRWAEFSERPLAYFEDRTYVGALRCRATESLLFAAGVRYFSQSQGPPDQYVGAAAIPSGFLRSIGPLTTVELNFGRRTRIFINGWYEHQVQNDVRSRDIATLTMSCSLAI